MTDADSEAGRAIASALAAEGLSLMLLGSPGARLYDVADDLAARHGIRCLAASTDVTDSAAVDRILMHVEQHLGPIDLVVSTVPGVLVGAALPAMTARGRGHVLHVAPSHVDADAAHVMQVELDPDAPDGLAKRVVAALA